MISVAAGAPRCIRRPCDTSGAPHPAAAIFKEHPAHSLADVQRLRRSNSCGRMRPNLAGSSEFSRWKNNRWCYSTDWINCRPTWTAWRRGQEQLEAVHRSYRKELVR
jgi:hypothetical protein